MIRHVTMQLLDSPILAQVTWQPYVCSKYHPPAIVETNYRSCFICFHCNIITLLYNKRIAIEDDYDEIKR